MNSRLIRITILAIAGLAPSAQACFCISPERPCDNDHDAAFVGHVTRVKRSGRDSKAELQVHLVIKEGFRGPQARGVDIVTSATSCGIAFREGQDYLVFANKKDGTSTLITHACSGTKLLRDSERELEHLRALAKGETRSGIHGVVTADQSDFVTPIRASKPLANVPIQLSGGGVSRLTFTDAEGNYEFGFLPVGRYQIRAELSDVPERQRSFDIDIAAGACGVQAFLSPTLEQTK
jgi:hypothetical protein